MKKTIKKLAALGLVFGLTVTSCMTAFAGEQTTASGNDSLQIYQTDDDTVKPNDGLAEGEVKSQMDYLVNEVGYKLSKMINVAKVDILANKIGNELAETVNTANDYFNKSNR